MAIHGTMDLSPARHKQRVCAGCGKVFACPTETRYKIVHKNRTRWFCSYGCFSPEDEKIRKAARDAYEKSVAAYELRMLGMQKKTLKELKAAEAKLVKRVELCTYKVGVFNAGYNAAKKGSTAKRKACDHRREWLKKLTYAEDELIKVRDEIRNIRGKQNAQDQRIHEGHGQDHASSHAR